MNTNKLALGFESEFIFPVIMEKGVSFSHNEQRQLMAKKIETYFGKKVTVSHRYHGRSKRKDSGFGQVFDHIEPDGSITQTLMNESMMTLPSAAHVCKTWVPAELSSMTYSIHTHDNPLQAFLDGVEDFFCFLAQNQCITNSSTGFHVTISGFQKGFNWKEVILSGLSNHSLKVFKRHNNGFCRSHLYRIFENGNVNGIFKQIEKNKNLSGCEDVLASRLEKAIVSNEKRLDIHFRTHDKTIIELRSMGGDFYHLRFDEIRDFITRFLGLVSKVEANTKQTSIRKIFQLYLRAMKKQPRSAEVIFSNETRSSNNKLINLIKFGNTDRKLVAMDLIRKPEYYIHNISTEPTPSLFKNLATVIKIAKVKKEIDGNNPIVDELINSLVQNINPAMEFERKYRRPDNIIHDWNRYFRLRALELPFEEMTILDHIIDQFSTTWYYIDDSMYGFSQVFKDGGYDKVMRAFDYVEFIMTRKLNQYFNYNSFISRCQEIISLQATQIEKMSYSIGRGETGKLKMFLISPQINSEAVDNWFSYIFSIMNRMFEVLKLAIRCMDKKDVFKKDRLVEFKRKIENYSNTASGFNSTMKCQVARGSQRAFEKVDDYDYLISKIDELLKSWTDFLPFLNYILGV